MAYGEIDYRSLDRMSQGIQSFNQGQLRNDQTRVQLQQDQADREVAVRASKQFFDAIKDEVPDGSPMATQTPGHPATTAQQGMGWFKYGQPSAQSGTPGATAPAQGAQPSGGTQAAPGKVPNYDKMFKAAAMAGETLAQGGGRHSQAAAQRIHQYLDDFVKIHPPASKMETEFDMFARGGPEGRAAVTDYEQMKGNAATTRTIAGKPEQLYQEDYDFGTGTKVKSFAMGYRFADGTMKVTHHEQIRPPMGGEGGPAKTTIGAITERTPTGELRLKRDASGKPVKITQKDHAALLEKLTNAKSQRDIKRDQLERQAVEAEDDAATTEALLKQPGMEADEFTKGIVKERRNKASTIRSQVYDLEKQGKDDESLLKDVQEYDPTKTDEAPKTAPKPVITHRYIPGKGAVPVGK